MVTRDDARNAQKGKERQGHPVVPGRNPLPASNRPGAQRAKQVISAGVIVYRRTRDGIKFLILYHGHNYWNFPKGKIENEEKSFEAALRETREETGLAASELRVLHNFRAHERFYYKWGGQPFFKIVIFYLAETKNPRIKVSEEHEGYGWFTAVEGMKIMAKYRDSQRVLKQAQDFLRGNTKPRHQERSQPRRPEPPKK